MSLLTLAVWIAATYSAVVAALNLLPTYAEYPLPGEMITAFTTLMSTLNAWNEILPIATLIYCAGIVFSAQLLVFLWKGARWLMGIIRGTTA